MAFTVYKAKRGKTANSDPEIRVSKNAVTINAAGMALLGAPTRGNILWDPEGSILGFQPAADGAYKVRKGGVIGCTIGKAKGLAFEATHATLVDGVLASSVVPAPSA